MLILIYLPLWLCLSVFLSHILLWNVLCFERLHCPYTASIRSYIDCDLSAQQPGLWFDAQKLKCEEMNRKGNSSTEGMWNQISFNSAIFTLRTFAEQECSSWQSALSKQSVSPFLLFSFPSIALPLLFCFPFLLSFSLPLSLQMGCLAGGRKESCASCECTAEAKRGNSLREQWELDSFVGYTAEAQHGGADKVQVWCVCVCVCRRWGCNMVMCSTSCSWFVIRRWKNLLLQHRRVGVYF